MEAAIGADALEPKDLPAQAFELPASTEKQPRVDPEAAFRPSLRGSGQTRSVRKRGARDSRRSLRSQPLPSILESPRKEQVEPWHFMQSQFDRAFYRGIP